MLTYANFCSSFTFKNCVGNSDAQAVFDSLCKPENIYNMISFTNLKLPAISGIAKNLERRMVKFILGHFGYEPLVGGLDERARLRNFSEAKLFKTASVYELKNAPINSIVMQII